MTACMASLAFASLVSTRTVATAPPGVRFVPTFRAVRHAVGVVPLETDVCLYAPSDRTSMVEIRAMLNGLSSTGQLEAARREVLARRQPDEHVLKAVAVGLALAEETDTDGALCLAVVRTALDGELYFG